METVKTAAIVLLLMAVLYGVYVVLNKPENAPSLTEVDSNRQTASELSVDFSSAKTSTTPPLSGGASADASPISAAVPPVPPPPVRMDPSAIPIPPASSIPTPPSFAAAEDSRKPAAEAPGSADSVPVPPSPITNLLSADAEKTSSGAATETPARELPQGAEASTPPDSLASSITVPPTAPIATADATEALPPEPPASGSTPSGSPEAAPSAWPAKPASYTEDLTPSTGPATAEAAPAASEAPAPVARNPENKPSAEFAGNAAAEAPAPASDSAADSGPARRTSFDRAMQSAQSKINAGEWYQALFTLSLQCSNADLSPADQQRLLDVLDPLAAKVIYSKEHLIEAPYDVRRGDTLNSVAQRYNVPWQLLANVNGLTDPEALAQGMQLKVIPGPFRAEVDVNGRELTLFLGRLYAGRFPISVGSDPSPPPGEYRVNDKQPGRTYYAADGRTIPVEDPRNPYGQIWIDLGGDVCIHGSPSTDADARMGCISLSPADANDLYGILSRGSAIVIRR
jgi:lipoprotein-anchoring transpeptidase ErfK/SrfK